MILSSIEVCDCNPHFQNKNFKFLKQLKRNTGVYLPYVKRKGSEISDQAVELKPEKNLFYSMSVERDKHYKIFPKLYFSPCFLLSKWRDSCIIRWLWEENQALPLRRCTCLLAVLLACWGKAGQSFFCALWEIFLFAVKDWGVYY